MKKLLSSILAFSFLAITGCQQTQDLGFLQNDLDSQQVLTSAKRNVRTDWFAGLKPELQAYYAPAKGKVGVELFDSLHDIISENNNISDYGTSKSYMYSTGDNITINGKTGLYDHYSYIFIPGSGGNGNSYKEQGDANKDGVSGDFINCEHTWPQSFFNKSLPMVADMHHLFPTMSIPNNRRGHHPFGEVTGGVVYTTSGGSKLGVIDKSGKNRSVAELKKLVNIQSTQEDASLAQGLDATFEPGDRQKGNTARGLLYFYLRYYDKNIRSGEFDDKVFWDSKVSTFVKWSETVDAVDENEVRRNEIIFKKQGNRNPFIDIPNLASIIGENVIKAK